MTMTVAI